jgi:rhodanese-related sulfurtransferase
MVDTSQANPVSRGCGCPCGKIILEAVMVGAAGLAFAFLANFLSPRGLNPARNYFPGDAAASKAAPAVVVPSKTAGGTNVTAPAPSPAVTLKERLEKNGLHLLERAEVEKLLHDPRREWNGILFIDARGEHDYQAGHIPGAFEFYPYYPQKYLENVLTPCQIAEQIVVFCAGGECEDSESAALFLRDAAGVPGEKLFIYGGGMTEWEAAKLPVEIGPRNSGNLRNPAP